ncbi:tail fiber domain-containing protein, partial [Candidatus Kaiserbacteria bacterium]|nr:tail fiber domain-containing protein [Candidatus Kaiserbacteria bacterium]
ASASGAITSTALTANTFPYASSTALTVSGTGYFGTASTTNLTFVNAAGTFAVITSATTTNFFTTNGSTTNATSTNFFSVLGRLTNGVVDTLLTAAAATITNLTATTLTATNATTTRVDAFDYVAVGRTATTTIRGDGVASTIPYASSTAITVSGTSFLSNLLAAASSTIGAGGQTTGLTISGGATTTQALVVQGTSASSTFAGNVEILGALKVGSGSIYLNGAATSTYSSGIQASALNLLSGGALTINGTSALNATTLGSGVTASSLTSVGTITSGVWTGTAIAVANGGTGATTAADARTNLGLGSLATLSSINNGNWSGTALAVANGGTGVTSSTGTGNTVLSASPTFTGTLSAAAASLSSTLAATGNVYARSKLNAGATSGLTIEDNSVLNVHVATNQNLRVLGPVNLSDGITLDSNNDAVSSVPGFEIRGTPIRLTGNVGIGMTPSYTLDVTGNARFNNPISVQVTPDSSRAINIDLTASQHGVLVDGAETSGYYALLGYSRASGSYAASGQAMVSGAVAGYFGDGLGNNCQFSYSSTSWSCSSDERLKTNIQTIDGADALAKLSQIRGVTFNWKADPNSGEKLGVIAQDILPVFPQAVSLAFAGGTTTSHYVVNYDSLIGPMISAINGLNVKIEDIATTTDVAPESFARRFFDSLKERLMAWFSDAENGIEKFFAKEIHAQNVFADTVQAKELCLDDVCISKPELQELLNLRGQAAAVATVSGGSSSLPPAPEPAPQPEQSEPEPPQENPQSEQPESPATEEPLLEEPLTGASADDAEGGAAEAAPEEVPTQEPTPAPTPEPPPTPDPTLEIPPAEPPTVE